MNLTHIFVFLSLPIFAGACQQGSKSIETEQSISALAQNEEPTLKKYDSGDVVFCGFLDSHGDLWFGTSREGVFRFDGTSFTNYSVKDGLSGNSVNEIIQDENGKLWFGTNWGISTYDGEKFEQIEIPFKDTTGVWLDEVYPIVNPNGVMSLLQAQDGNIWLGTNGAGAYKYDGTNFTSYLADKGDLQVDGLYHNIIMSLSEDDDGNIWFSSFTHGGVSKYDGSDFTHYTIEDGVGDDMIMTSFKDRSGNIWFGTRAGGMSFYDGEKFTLFTEADALCNNNVSSFYEDEEGTLLLGSFSRNGMCSYDGQTFQPFPLEGQPNMVDIRFTIKDRDGNLWFGGRYGQLWKYDGKEFVDYTQRKRQG